MGKVFKVLALATVFSLLMATTALAAPNSPGSGYNQAQGWAYHEVVGVTEDSITVTFYAVRNFFSCWEIRTDSEAPLAATHPYVSSWLDGKWKHQCANGSSVTVTFPANSHIEVRLSFGAESDERYDWERTDVLPSTPVTAVASAERDEHSDCNMVGSVPDWIPYYRSDVEISWLANWCGVKVRSIESGLWMSLPILDKHYALIDDEGNGQWTATLAPISPTMFAPGYYVLTMGTNSFKVWIGTTPPGK